MTIILSLQARKGGVGKTTVSVTLAAALALSGLSVLIVDSDGQGNATTSVGLEARDDFYALILEDAEYADLIRPVPKAFAGKPSSLYLLSASDAQRRVESSASTPARMVERLAELRGVYDVVIGDTSPGLTEVHSGWYYASDYVILPTLCETHSVRSVGKTLEFLHSADAVGRERGYPAAQVLGILPNRYTKGVNNSQFNLGLLSGLYQQYPIYERMRDLSAWESATRQSKSIYSLSAGSDRRLAQSLKDARKEFSRVVESVLALVQEKAA